ncbi:MAG: sensor histidine kinase [Vulcanococcus sp.]
MQVSKRYLALVDQQLAQFADRPDLRSLVVYLTLPGDNGKPALIAIGHWPARPGLPPEQAPGVNAMAERQGDGNQRWLPLRDGALVLGVLRVETDHWPWPAPLQQRLNATARCLSEALRLDRERQRLGQALAQRDDQLRLLVHQLRNPLAALRTFGQLLRRRLEGDLRNRSLVDQLLVEQGQLSRYVEAIDLLAEDPALPAAAETAAPLLLPPALSSAAPQALSSILEPLLERAAATAALQGRPWHGPNAIPPWSGDGAAVGEIVANLLENAFRYSPAGQAIGLMAAATEGGVALGIWDSGPAIPTEERQRIFLRGERGSTGLHRPGTGLGLALGRDLARSLGGELALVVPPRALNPNDPALPEQGNGFRLWLPAEPTQAPGSAQPQA